MTIDEARKEIESLKKYIKMMEEYDPQNMKEEAMKLYVELESVTKVAKLLNEKEYKINNRKIISKDISDLIREKPTDDMHELAARLFNRNKKRSSKSFW